MGSGDIEASASEKVSVTLMGSGDVVVSGSPKKVSSSNLGSGDVSIR
jgi:2-keto-4-pentenoate hydratase/2-oxohepta-3-ene-1,7-dioic acid hydratase in catechol pathway